MSPWVQDVCLGLSPDVLALRTVSKLRSHATMNYTRALPAAVRASVHIYIIEQHLHHGLGNVSFLSAGN